MKTIHNLLCLAGLTGGLFASYTVLAVPEAPADDPAPANPPAATADAATQTPQPPAETAADAAPPPAQPKAATPIVAAPAAASDSKVNAPSVAPFPAGQGLRLNFQGVALQQVLDYMSQAAGFIINVTRGVDVRGKVDVWSAQPLSKEEAVDLLKKVLNENGYTVMQDKRVLTIISSSEAKDNAQTPVVKVEDYATFPNDTSVVTAIIPVHGLNASQLLKDMKDLLPPGVQAVANENANSIVITDTHANIRRVAEIVATLDSVTSGVNTLEVFPLQYADAKSVSDMLKDLFPSSQDSNSRNGGGIFGTRFGRGGRGGFFGGFPGMPGGDTGGDNSSTPQAPTTHVGAVADDHSNSIIVSAPEGLMAIIEKVIKEIDVPVQAVTDYRVFKLKHADPVEMAELISNLYSDDNNTSDASRQGQSGYPGRGGFFSAMMAAAQRGNGNEASSRMKLMGHVNAQPDPRTSSLVVVAAKELMPGIEAIVKQLDENPAKIVKIHTFQVANANVYDVQQVLHDLFPQPAGMSSTSAATAQQNNVLASRETTLMQQQNQSAASANQAFGTTPGRP